MNRDEIRKIEHMWKIASNNPHHDTNWYDPAVVKFAELVRADEREKYKWDVHSCGPTCKRYACVSMREAIEAEREACAVIAETPIGGEQDDITMEAKDRVAAAIRARSNT